MLAKQARESFISNVFCISSRPTPCIAQYAEESPIRQTPQPRAHFDNSSRLSVPFETCSAENHWWKAGKLAGEEGLRFSTNDMPQPDPFGPLQDY